MSIELPPDHRRSISTTVQVVERVLNEMEELLESKKENIAAVITKDFSDQEILVLREKINALRNYNHHIFRTFNLSQTEQNQSQILQAQTAYLWTVLMDSKSKKLRGFGKLSPAVASALDEEMDVMLRLLDELTKHI